MTIPSQGADQPAEDDPRVLAAATALVEANLMRGDWQGKPGSLARRAAMIALGAANTVPPPAPTDRRETGLVALAGWLDMPVETARMLGYEAAVDAVLARVHAREATTVAAARGALERIDRHGCTNVYGGARCSDPCYGRTRDAEYTADAWCDACVAHDALRHLTGEDRAHQEAHQDQWVDPNERR